MYETKTREIHPISQVSFWQPKYNVYDLPLYIKREYLSDYPHLQTPPHWCEDLETVFMMSGSMRIVVNGEIITINENEICVINAGCIHYFLSCDMEDCSYVRVLINESVFSTSPMIREKYINPIYHSYHPNYEIIKDSNPYYKQLAHQYSTVQQILSENDSSQELIIISCLHEYLYLLWNMLKDSYFLTQPIDTHEAEDFRYILSYIHTNYGKRITIEELCRQTGISRNKCFILFKKYTGISPSQYILDYRLSISKSLLITTNMTISQIANSCGFSHQSHYTEYFSKYYGTTPLKYRKSTRINS